MPRDLLLPAWLFEAGIVATVLGSAYLGRCQGFFQATFHGFVVLGAFTGASLFLEPTRQWLAYEGVSGSLQYLTAYLGLISLGLVIGTLFRKVINRAAVARFSVVIDGLGGIAAGLLTGVLISAIFQIAITMLPPKWSTALPFPRPWLDFGRNALICFKRGLGEPTGTDALLTGEPLNFNETEAPGTQVSSEFFVDLNFDGSYSVGEPFLDETGDGKFSEGIPFVDLDGNEQRTLGVLSRYRLRSWGMTAAINGQVPKSRAVADKLD